MTTRLITAKRPKSAARLSPVAQKSATVAQTGRKTAQTGKKPAQKAPKIAAAPAGVPISAHVSTCILTIPGHVRGIECASLPAAQQAYERLRNSSGLGSRDFAEGEVSRDGQKIARISYNGRAWSPAGMVISEPQGAGGEEKEAPAPVDQVELAPPVAVSIPAHLFAAALAIAPKAEKLAVLNSVFLHTVGNTLRIVAADGHRVIVLSHMLDKPLPWGDAGLILPRADLERITKYIGRDRATLIDVCFGEHHPVVRIADTIGHAVFVVKPIEGKFINYQKALDSSANVLNGAERTPMDVSAVDAKYLATAGAIARALGSHSVFPFISDMNSKDACIFTFAGEPGALLMIMPVREPSNLPAISNQVVSTIGALGMQASLRALKAHQTRAIMAVEKEPSAKRKAELVQRAESYDARIRSLQAILTALPAPAAPVAEEGSSAKAN